MIYSFPIPITQELLDIDKNHTAQTLLIDTRPIPDERLQMNWRGQYRYVGPRCRLDLAWLNRMGFVLVILGRYVEGSVQEGR